MKQTTLDLNGPVLSFTTNPVGVASTGVISGSTGSGIATFVGIATALFPTGISTGSPSAPTNVGSNSGIITYRWYEVGVGALSDSQYVTGTGTTSLTLSRLITPTDNQRQFYVTAEYIPSAYQSATPVTAGTARSTGNAVNEPTTSETGTLTVYPLLEIVSQPSSTSSLIGQNATFSVNAGLTDNSFADDLVYEWYLDGVLANDGQIVQYSSVNVTTTTISPPQTINQVRYRSVSTSSERSDNRTFYSDGSVDLHPSSNNIKLEVASGSGGNGGSDAAASGGVGGGGRYGRFTYKFGGRRLDFRIGRRGNDGASGAIKSGGGSGASNSCADGGRGGDASLGSGASGGGGGGGSATCVFDSAVGRETIIAAGGSGGGGASLNVPGLNGSAAGGFNRGNVNIRFRGTAGESASTDGGGGGGAGGGSLLTTDVLVPSADGVGQGGGRTQSGKSGQDNDSTKGTVGRAAEGGGATYGAHDTSQVTLDEAGKVHNGDGFVKISWRWTESSSYLEPYTEQVTVPGTEVTTTTTQSVPRTITLSGTRTPILTISADTVGINTVTCKISSATATNSSIISAEAVYTSVSSADQFNINIETIGLTNTAATSSINLFNGEYTFTKLINGLYCFYAPDRDIAVEMDLYGGKGDNAGSYLGGEGGFSRIRFTMERNTEYIVTGMIDSIGTPFIYKKGQLIACVGKGGNAGTGGKGGFGGGINVGGESGSGRGAGIGGAVITSGNLASNGIFGSLTSLTATSPDTKASIPNGGRSIKCSKGVYWQAQGVSACADVGSTQYRLSDGTVVANTASITRGYKAGYDITQTAGAGSGGGNGGNGASGGNGGITGGGGGGGSGYTDGSVTVVSTQLGGNFGDQRVVLRRVS